MHHSLTPPNPSDLREHIRMFLSYFRASAHWIPFAQMPCSSPTAFWLADSYLGFKINGNVSSYETYQLPQRKIVFSSHHSVRYLARWATIYLFYILPLLSRLWALPRQKWWVFLLFNQSIWLKADTTSDFNRLWLSEHLHEKKQTIRYCKNGKWHIESGLRTIHRIEEIPCLFSLGLGKAVRALRSAGKTQQEK